MLYMVVETFKKSCLPAVKDRFKREGRLLPEGVSFVDSWMTEDGDRCFQVMKAAHPQALRTWTERWGDLVEFEVVPILPSAEFWSNYLPAEL